MMEAGSDELSRNCLLLRRKHCQLATRLLISRWTAVSDCVARRKLISLLRTDLIPKCFQESVAMLFGRICRSHLAGTGLEPEYLEGACIPAAFL
jgi:hypothetical protein